MLSWVVGAAVLLLTIVLLAAAHTRRERKRSSAEMRDYMRRNFRIGEKPWD